jgi:hypothetical protein
MENKMTITKEEIMKNTKDKRDAYATTTSKFKSDLIDFFIDKNLNTIAEVSGWGGHTTRILSYLFKNILFIEHPNNFDTRIMGKIGDTPYTYLKDRDNVKFIPLDVYATEWNFPELDAIFIDCVHRYAECCSDITNGLKYVKMGGYFVFDDYTLSEDNFGVRRAIHKFIEDGKLEFISYLGEEMEFYEKRPVKNKDLDETWEGILCKKI